MIGRTNVNTTNKIELALTPGAAFPRYLNISWRARMLTIDMRLPQSRFQTVAFAIANPSDGPTGESGVRLSISQNGLGVFWASRAAFDLSAEEAVVVRTALEPFGLYVEYDSISAAPIGPCAAKESVRTAIPPSGARGVSLAPEYVGAGASDLSNEIGYDG